MRPDDVALAERMIDELVTVIRTGQSLAPETVGASRACCARSTSERPADVLTLDILSSRGRTIRPKTLNQKRYVDAIDTHTVVFGIGPAGTGKTYLAVAKAVQALQAKQVRRIILTRPAVEAGERLGFLPGTLYEKIDPYLRPLYDALHDMLDPDTIPRLMTQGTIEVAPLAYMRGRTLNDAFIILDEAQNTSPEQMKMFLTRLGFGSKVVVTGDVTQIDLPAETRSGLQVVQEILDDLDDVQFCRLHSVDVVRHRLVGDIVDAYGRWDATQVAVGREPPRRHAAATAATETRSRARRMSIEVANESGAPVDEYALVALARHVLDRMGIHPQAELSIALVNVDAMSALHEHWMGEPGPTDVLAFPMDEHAPADRTTPSPTPACSATSCSARPWRRPRRSSTSGTMEQELRPALHARDPPPARLRPRRAGGASARCSRCRTSCSRTWRASATAPRLVPPALRATNDDDRVRHRGCFVLAAAGSSCSPACSPASRRR